MKALSALLLWAASATPVEGGIPVRGRIADAQGRPLHRVMVRLLPIADDALEPGGGADDAASPRATPDARGFFELGAPRQGFWRVVVEAPGTVAMEIDLLPLVEDVELPPLELARASRLEVRVTGGGRALAGAAVMLDGPQARGEGWRPRPRVARTSGDGIATLPRLRGADLRLRVVAAAGLRHEHPPAELSVAAAGGDRAVDVELGRGAERTFQVVDAQGAPQPAAEVRLGRRAPPLARSDAGGRFSLAIADPLAVEVAAGDGSGGRFELRSGGPATLRLAPPRLLRGRVAELAGRDPIASAWIWTSAGVAARSDGRGLFTLAVPAFAGGGVEAAAAGFGRIAALPLAEASSRPADLEILLPAAATVRGRVVDGAGRALEDVAIHLDPPLLDPLLTAAGIEMRPRAWRARSRRDGSFTLPGLVARASHRLAFRKAGFVTQERAVEALAAFETRSGLEVTLRAGRLGIGRVYDREGEPVAGARVRLRPRPEHTPAQRLLPHLLPPADVYVTAADGRYEAPDLGAGLYDLHVEAEGFGATLVPGVEIPESRQAAVDLGTVTLLPAVAFEGRVVDPGGGAIAGARVAVARRPLGPGPAPASTERLSDAGGGFAIAGLRDGERPALRISRPGYVSRRLTGIAAPTARPVEIVLHPAAEVTGRVVDPGHHPIAGATVWAGGTAAESADAVLSGDDGRFVLPSVAAGVVSIFARAPSYVSAELSGVETEAGETVDGVEIVLDPGAVLAGTVRDARGEPVLGAYVRVARHPPVVAGRPRVARTGAGGRYRLDGLPPGPARLSAQHADHPGADRAVELREGDNAADLAFPAGVEVSGWVRGPGGAPVAAAEVTVESAPEEPGMSRILERMSLADGSFRIGDVAPGRYLLSAGKEGLARSAVEFVDVREAPVDGVELRLGEGATLSGRILGAGLDELALLALLAWPSDGEPGARRRGRVDHEGIYRITNLRPGTWNVLARVPDSGLSASAQVVLEAGQDAATRDLELRSGLSLEGVVHDRGRPLAGGRVFVRRGDGLAGQSALDASGSFRIDHLPPGSSSILIAHGGVLLHSESFELVAGRDYRADLDTATVSGRVADEYGRPLPAAVVTLERLDGGADPRLSRLLAGGRLETDSVGRFTVAHLPPGSFRLRAARAGYAAAETRVEVTASQVLDDLVLSSAQPAPAAAQNPSDPSHHEPLPRKGREP